jgi:2,5-diketo-D-gluconate reductase B
MPTIPSPGLGTSGNDDPERCAETVATALEMGYRHVDTAQMYDNEAAVGEGIERSAVDREDVFLATKVHPENLGADDVRETTEASLDRLGVDAVDLLYVHWPTDAYDPAATLPAFDRLREAGATRHVGVSNFTPALLDEARETLDAPVVANQVEVHPLFQQDDLRAYAREHDLALVAYAPLMRGDAADVPELREVAADYDATPTEVSLAWLRSKETVVPIPKATGEEHLRANLDVPDLDAADVATLDAIDREKRLVDPDGAPWN